MLAIVIFGIFLSLSYWLFEGEFKGILSTVMEGVKTGQFSNVDNTFASDKTLGPYGNFTVQPTPASDFEFDPATGTLIKYKGTENKIVVPFEIDGVEVKIIGGYFSSESNHVFNEIILPNTIITLEEGAFLYSNLTSISLPNSVEYIGEAAFGYSESLQSIEIGNKLKSIGSYAFMYTTLNGINLPDKSFTIGDNAFMYTPNLKSVYLGGVKSIGELAFMNSGIVTIKVPNTVNTIGEGVFQNTKSLKTITIGSGIDFVSDNLLLGSSVEEITFETGGSDKTFGDVLFTNTNNLSKLVLPQNVNSFNGYSILSNSALKEFTFPGSMKEITEDNKVNMGGSSVEDLRFGEGITKITGTFSELNGKLKTVTLPNSLITLGDSVFYGGDSLTNVNFGANLESIGNDTFVSARLTELSLPSSLKTIGSGAFSGNSLTNLELPNSVTSIGEESFVSNSLTSIKLSTSMTEIPDAAFADNKLTSINIPNNIKRIGNSAFAGNQITSVIIPDSVTSLGSHAFSNANLTTVELPNSFVGKDLTGLFPDTTIITYR